MDTIFRHRSIRKYKSTPIKAKVLDYILKAGVRASTTGNMQVYSIIVTKEKAMREKLWELHSKKGVDVSKKHAEESIPLSF